MQGETIITEQDLQTRFQGERDLVTCAPYRVGDKIVRCGSCRAIVKSEFVTSNYCPLCGHSPFSPGVVSTSHASTILERRSRKLKPFLLLLILSAAMSLIPFAFPEVAGFLCEAAFGIGIWGGMVCAGIIGVVVAIILYNNRTVRRWWQTSAPGVCLIVIPSVSPYAVLAATWAVMVVVSIFVAIAIVVAVVALIGAIISGLD